MVQTDRKAEATRQSPKEGERAPRKQDRELRSEATLALEAILSGESWQQLSAEGVLALSHTVGNSALAELAALRSRETEVEAAHGPLPAGPCLTAPMDLSAGEPHLAAAPDFGGMSSLGSAAPLDL